MEPLIAVAGFLFVAAITPGPNNAIILAAAAQSGLPGAMPPIAGVLGGGLALLALVWAGAGALFETAPALRHLLLIAGALYLVWLGGGLMWRSGRTDDPGVRPQTLPGTVIGVATFQILNPKSWVLVTTASAAMPGDVAGFGWLAAMMVVVPGLCLMLWAIAGVTIAGRLRQPGAQRRFDRIMGGLLIVAAALLVGQPAVSATNSEF